MAVMMNDRVSAWLDSLGLSVYHELFEHNAITWDVLPELNEGDLEALCCGLIYPDTSMGGKSTN